MKELLTTEIKLTPKLLLILAIILFVEYKVYRFGYHDGAVDAFKYVEENEGAEHSKLEASKYGLCFPHNCGLWGNPEGEPEPMNKKYTGQV